MKGDFSRFTFQPSKHYNSVRQQQGRVQLDADWNEQVEIQAHRDRIAARDMIGVTGAPYTEVTDPLANFKIAVDASMHVQIGPGIIYVDGLLCEQNDPKGVITVDQQPYIAPNAPYVRLSNGTLSATIPDGLYVVYLDVWERLVTSIEDPEILEPALGGPDTATRAQTIWQAQLLQVGDKTVTAQCGDTFAAWTTLTTPSSGKLTARVQPGGGTSTDPCVVTPGGGYTRLENQLYRVEIHDSSGAGPGTLKWSRDNGSVAVAWTAQAGNDLTVVGTSSNASLFFATGQWVELIDDSCELAGTPGTLVQLAGVNGNVLTINPTTAKGNTALSHFPLNARVRRWDMDANGLMTIGANVSADGYVTLEDGLQISFAQGTYRTGDYWVIPARTVTANVDWPTSNGAPASLPPKGITHHYCRLALVKMDTGTLLVMSDCRSLFRSLIDVQAKLEPLILGSDTNSGVTITQIQPYNDPTSRITNDTPVSIATFAQGVKIVCSEAIDPGTLSQATCFVTLDLPYPFTTDERTYWGAAVIGYRPLTIDGSVGVVTGNPNVISWVPSTPSATTFLGTTLFQKMSTDSRGTQVLARLRLKGNFIWSALDPTRLLDGDPYGVRVPGTHNTDITFPTGDGRRGGDFEMWFWLVPNVVTLSQLAIAPAQVHGTANATGTITLSGGALSGGAGITVVSNNPAAVPQSPVIVTGGTTGATFTIATQTVAQDTTVSITASMPGSPPIAPQSLIILTARLASITLKPTTAVGGATVTAVVAFDSPTPAGGVLVTLQAQGSGFAPIPPTVQVPAGATQATFAITTQWTGDAPTTATISASFGGITQSATLTRRSDRAGGVAAHAQRRERMIGGNGLSGTVVLNRRARSREGPPSN